jgi:CRP-like cAMP-binding protein
MAGASSSDVQARGRTIIGMTEAPHIENSHRDSRDGPSFRNNELLAGISDEMYAQVADKISVVECDPNEIIFEENDPENSLYLIADGSVKISKKGRAGQQETLAYLMERDFFGEMALVDSGKRSAQAAAVDRVVVGRIDREGWDLLLHLAPHLVLGNFTRSVTKRLRHNNQHFIEEVMRNERLSLIGTTISSIVHDMNNPISCILCACEVIRKNNPDGLTSEAAELLPVSKDAVDGPSYIINLAMIYAWTGEKDLALEQLAIAARIPGGVTYGELKLYPQWDSLRDNPRFEKIVASLAPKR